MDIISKHIPLDKDGVRIAELDEMSYRQKLWSYRLVTDIWRVASRYSTKLESKRFHTRGDIQNKKSIIDDCKTAKAMQAINDNKRYAVNQTEWAERSEKYLKRHEEITVLLESFDAEKAERIAKSKVIAQFIKRASLKTSVQRPQKAV